MLWDAVSSAIFTFSHPQRAVFEAEIWLDEMALLRNPSIRKSHFELRISMCVSNESRNSEFGVLCRADEDRTNN